MLERLPSPRLPLAGQRPGRETLGQLQIARPVLVIYGQGDVGFVRQRRRETGDREQLVPMDRGLSVLATASRRERQPAQRLGSGRRRRRPMRRGPVAALGVSPLSRFFIEPSKTERLRRPGRRRHASLDHRAGHSGQQAERHEIETIVLENIGEHLWIASPQICHVASRDLAARNIALSPDAQHLPL